MNVLLRSVVFPVTEPVPPILSRSVFPSRHAMPDSGAGSRAWALPSDDMCVFSWQDLSELNSTTVKSPTNTVTVQNLKAGTIYVFQVRARTVAGYGRYSGKMYFQTMTEGKSSAVTA